MRNKQPGATGTGSSFAVLLSSFAVCYGERNGEWTVPAPWSFELLTLTAFSKTDFRKARVATFGGGLRTSLPTSRRACASPATFGGGLRTSSLPRASPARAGLAVPSQPPSEPMTFSPETARSTERCVATCYNLSRFPLPRTSSRCARCRSAPADRCGRTGPSNPAAGCTGR